MYNTERTKSYYFDLSIVDICRQLRNVLEHKKENPFPHVRATRYNNDFNLKTSGGCRSAFFFLRDDKFINFD